MSASAAFVRMLVLAMAALLVSLPSTSNAQTPAATQEDEEIPVFRSQGWGYIVAEFSTRMSSYYQLRTALESALPRQVITDDPAEIARGQRALARRIRAARTGAKQGDIFTSSIRDEFRKALAVEVDDLTLAVILDDNPGDVAYETTGDYPRGQAFSTVPAKILAVLPRLPDDVQYRFAGRDLFLLDIRANVILDRIPDAIRRRSDGKSADGSSSSR